MNEKIDNSLQLALSMGKEELEKSQQLSFGFNPDNNRWDLIIKYISNEFTKTIPGIVFYPLSNGYGIVNVEKKYIEMLTQNENIIYVEKPKELSYQVLEGKRASCINPYQTGINNNDLFGEGVIVGIIDTGIDYANKAFMDKNGNSRIEYLWDQETDTVYDNDTINQAIKSDNPQFLVASKDISGHGTHVAGIAAGNFSEKQGGNLGIATKSRLIVVKLKGEIDNTAITTYLMRAVQFIVDKGRQMAMPMAINISVGTNLGSHDGTSLLCSYLDSIINENQISIQIGTGNEGDKGIHASGRVELDEEKIVELQVGDFQNSFSIQIWKSFSDEFEIRLIHPSGNIQIIINENQIVNQTLGNTIIAAIYGSAVPYSKYQEIYIEFIPKDNFVDYGLWKIIMVPKRVITGKYNMWIATGGDLSNNTFFSEPDSDTTLTIPSTCNKAIAVGAYNTGTNTVPSFSGRGFLRQDMGIKPDIVAPGVNILSTKSGGGTEIRTGTSMATPFATGMAALMMEWGIVRGNDRYMYGEKLKAYMIRNANQIAGVSNYPNKAAGWGRICLKL